jgi:uncharacterized protein (PEP-CTERM system associated)
MIMPLDHRAVRKESQGLCPLPPALEPVALWRRPSPSFAHALAAGSMLASFLLVRPAYAQLADPADGGVVAVGGTGADIGSAASGPPSLPPPTDTLLPRTGIDTTDSDLRNHLASAFAPSGSATGTAPPSGLVIYKQIGVSETYTTNAGYELGGYNAGSDFITSIQPLVRVVDNTQRLQVDLTYDPIGQIYARHGGFDQIQEQAFGDILATLVPDWLYLDTRGSVYQQAIFGGLGPAGTVTLSPNERETVTSVSISPYVTHTFGGAGTLVAGVGYSYSAVDASNALNNDVFAGAPANGLGDYASSYLNSERAFASWTTGENYGRFRDRIATDDSIYQGSGALRDAHRLLVVDDVSYAFTRLVTGLGEVGYEWLNYPAAGYQYDGVIGAGGVELTPSKNSEVVVEYRYLDGFGSLFVQGSAQVTPRIRVFGGYSEGISTFQQDLQTSLLQNDSTVTGVAATALTASPLLQTTNFFGGNEYLSRVRRLDATATYLGNRDTASVSFEQEHTTPVGHPVGDLVPVSTSGWFVSGTERHEITPTLSAGAFVQYGHSRTGLVTYGSGDTVSFSLSLDKLFTQTLTGYVRVGGTYVVSGSVYGTSGYEDLSGDETDITVGAVKRF